MPRLHHYQTVYFDTVDLALYTAHHDQRRNRYKVRSRRYVDSSQAFLEVKHKVNSNRTIKSRTQTHELVTRFTPETSGFSERALSADPRAAGAHALERLLSHDAGEQTATGAPDARSERAVAQ